MSIANLRAILFAAPTPSRRPAFESQRDLAKAVHDVSELTLPSAESNISRLLSDQRYSTSVRRGIVEAYRARISSLPEPDQAVLIERIGSTFDEIEVQRALISSRVDASAFLEIASRVASANSLLFLTPVVPFHLGEASAKRFRKQIADRIGLNLAARPIKRIWCFTSEAAVYEWFHAAIWETYHSQDRSLPESSGEGAFLEVPELCQRLSDLQSSGRLIIKLVHDSASVINGIVVDYRGESSGPVAFGWTYDFEGKPANAFKATPPYLTMWLSLARRIESNDPAIVINGDIRFERFQDAITNGRESL
ncbi:MAG: hypothetical protein ACYC96_06320 [Fimbriimonadaceae bacterium]